MAHGSEMGEGGDHKPVSGSVYSNMEAIDMTAAGEMSCVNMHVSHGTVVTYDVHTYEL